MKVNNFARSYLHVKVIIQRSVHAAVDPKTHKHNSVAKENLFALILLSIHLDLEIKRKEMNCLFLLVTYFRSMP